MMEAASEVIFEVLGRKALDLDEPIIDYIIKVLADEDFDFGFEGDGAYDAIGELLVDSGCIPNYSECESVKIAHCSLVFVLEY